MSRTCRYMGDSGKLRFYEPDRESKMRLLKTHSHTSNGLAMEPETREEKQVKVQCCWDTVLPLQCVLGYRPYFCPF